MVQMFLESLLLGTLLTTLFYGTNYLLRRAVTGRRYTLPAGQELRCVQPLDLGER